MKRSAMNDVHNINKIALTSYANHQLQNLRNQYGIGQVSAKKKPPQDTLNTNTSGNKKVSSLWEELNEEKSKPESSNSESSQLQQALQKIQELEQALIQANQNNHNLTNQLNVKDNVIEEKNNKITQQGEKIEQQGEKIEIQANKILELQEKLLEKTEQVNMEHNKYIDTKYKVDVVKVKLTNFIDNHQNIEGQDQLVEMLGDLNIGE